MGNNDYFKKQLRRVVTEKGVYHPATHGGPHFILGTSDPLGDVKTPMSHAQVLDALHKMGEWVDSTHGTHESGGVEPTIIVKNPKNIDALHTLAANLGQESAVLSDGGMHEMHYYAGPNAGKIRLGQGTEVRTTRPKSNYTTLMDKSGQNRFFSHNFDWDDQNLVDAGAPIKKDEDSPDDPMAKLKTPATVQFGFGDSQARAIRDAASENNGIIHKRQLNKLKLDPKKAGVEHLVDPHGNLSIESLNTHIKANQQYRYNTDHGMFDQVVESDFLPDEETRKQRHSNELSNVFRVEATPWHVNQMKGAGVYDNFKKMMEISQRSGHPVGETTIGWARYTHGPDGGIHIDEVQSDFGQLLEDFAEKQGREMRILGYDNDQINGMIQNVKRTFPDSQMKKLNGILLGDKEAPDLVHEAFMQRLRDSGFAGKQIALMGHKAKSELAGMKPEPELQPHEGRKNWELLSPQEKQIAIKKHLENPETPDYYKGPEHIDTWAKRHHYVFDKTTGKLTGNSFLPYPVHTRKIYSQFPKRKWGYKKGTYGELATQNNEKHHGKQTWTKPLRKYEGNPNEDARETALRKFEWLFKDAKILDFTGVKEQQDAIKAAAKVRKKGDLARLKSNLGHNPVYFEEAGKFLEGSGHDEKHQKYLGKMLNKLAQKSPAELKDFRNKLESLKGTDKSKEIIRTSKGGYTVPNYHAAITGKIGDKPTGAMDDAFSWTDTSHHTGKKMLVDHFNAGKSAQVHTSSDLIAHNDYAEHIPHGSTVHFYAQKGAKGFPSERRLKGAGKKLESLGVKVQYHDFDSIPKLVKEEMAEWETTLRKLDELAEVYPLEKYNITHDPEHDTPWAPTDLHDKRQEGKGPKEIKLESPSIFGDQTYTNADFKKPFWEEAPVMFSKDTNSARMIRDMADDNGGIIHKKAVENAGHNIDKAGIKHLISGKGQLKSSDIQNHINKLPKHLFDAGFTSYGTEGGVVEPSYELMEDWRDSAQEGACDNYSIQEYIEDNVDVYDLPDYKKMFNNHLFEGNYNFKEKNPDYDPNEEDSDEPEFIDYSDDPHYSVEDHPEWEEIVEEVNEKVKRNYIDKLHDEYGPDVFLGDYGNYIQEDVDSQYSYLEDSWRDDQPMITADEEQRHSDEASEVFQLNTPNHLIDQMKDEGLYDLYDHILSASENEDHPVRNNTLGWLRFTGGEGGDQGVHIDEIQSDFETELKNLEKQISNNDSPATQRYSPESVHRLREILFGNAKESVTKVIHEAFLQKMRNAGMEGTPVHIWDLPRKQGLSQQQREPEIDKKTQKAVTYNQLTPEQKDQWAKSLDRPNVISHAADQKPFRFVVDKKTGNVTEYYKPAPAHMRTTYRKDPKKMGYKPSQYGKLSTQSGDHSGESTWAHNLRKREDMHRRFILNGSLTSVSPSQYSLLRSTKGTGDAILRSMGKLTDPCADGKYWSFLTKSVDIRTEGRIFVSMDGDNIGASVERAAMSDDLDTIVAQSELIFSGQAMIRDWAHKFGADIYIDGGDDMAFTLPRQHMFALKDLKDSYHKTTGFTITIGVGNTISQAGHSMLYGKLHGKDQINMWSKDLDEELESISRTMTPHEKMAGHGLLGKNEGDQGNHLGLMEVSPHIFHKK